MDASVRRSRRPTIVRLVGLDGDCFLVTGSEGCLGSWVVKNLVETGERAVALDLAPDGVRLRRLLPEHPLDTVAFVPGDIVADGLLPAVIEEHGVTRVIHLAALQIPLVAADPGRGALVNVVGTTRVLEAARAHAGRVRGLVYASSAAVFGAGGRPGTLYGVFKVCNEETARVFWDDFGVASAGVRPWAVFGYGRDQGLTAAPTHAMKAAVLGVPYRIPFGGRLDLQYADDVARTVVELARLDTDGSGVYNLRGSVVSVGDVVAVIERLRPESRGLLSHDEEPLPIDPELDDAPLRSLLGAVPRTDFAAAVAETLDTFERLKAGGRLSAADIPAA
jgi:UDP-glucuronate 4-epimerase